MQYYERYLKLLIVISTKRNFAQLRNITLWNGAKYTICKMEYTFFFRGILPVSLFLVLGALRVGLPSSPIEIYITIGLGIFVLKNYTRPHPRNDPEMMSGYTQSTWKKLILTLNVSHKFTLANAMLILLTTIFSLFYLNVLRMSDSYVDVMSSLYVTCKLPLVNN